MPDLKRIEDSHAGGCVQFVKLLQPILRDLAIDVLPVVRELLHRVLGRIVVPGDPVVVQKSEQLPLVLEDPLLVALCQF